MGSDPTPAFCPLCETRLLSRERKYRIEDVFSLWGAVKFPQAVIDEHLSMGDSTELFHCPKCALEIFIPQIIGTPSFYAAASNQGGHSAKAGYYEENKWDFSEAFNDVPKQGKIIEFGCGPGKFLSMASTLAKEVVGIESNPIAASSARSMGLEVYESINALGSTKDKFDAAFSFHVLEHVANPKTFLESLVSQVKKGGVIGISVPNQDGPIRYIEPCAMNMPPHHATRWCLKTFEVAAHQLGLDICRVAYEPLLLENHSYYSIFWLNQLMPGDKFPVRLVRQTLSLFLRAGFKALRLLGLKNLPFLRGQSIYITMVARQPAN